MPADGSAIAPFLLRANHCRLACRRVTAGGAGLGADRPLSSVAGSKGARLSWLAGGSGRGRLWCR